MNHLAAFFTSRLKDEYVYGVRDKTSYLENAGNFLLSPVRYLANGRYFTVIRTPESQGTQFERLVGQEYHNGVQSGEPLFMDSYHPVIRDCVSVILAIIAFVPAILGGTLVKGLALLNADARDRHCIAAQNRRVIDKKIIEQFETTQDLKDALNDPYRRRIKTLIIHGNGDPIGPENIGFNRIDITERIVLINTEFAKHYDATNKSPEYRLHYQLFLHRASNPYVLGCQNFECTEKGINPTLTQHRVKSLDEAQNFPLSRNVKKVFIVEE